VENFPQIGSFDYRKIAKTVVLIIAIGSFDYRNTKTGIFATVKNDFSTGK
jgi:hypothetical protein